jgi:hypothetical protein
LQHLNWQTVAKAVIGFLLGLLIWGELTPSYNIAIASGAQGLMRTFERPAVTRLHPNGSEIIVERDDFPPRSKRPGLPADDLTFNIVLLCALFAANPTTFSTSNVVRFGLALLILFLVHIVAFIAKVESLYALELGPWSAAHYGPIARNFWSGSSHFYRIVGVYAAAFLTWWMLRPSPSAGPADAPKSAKKRRKRR